MQEGGSGAIVTAVEQRLGAATSALYGWVCDLVDRAIAAGPSAERTRLALAGLGLDVLCGRFHDYRAGAPNPKGDLIEALRAVPTHPAVDHQINGLIRRVLLGEFEDGSAEAQRFVARAAPAPRNVQTPDSSPPEAIELSPALWRVFAWLYRYIEVYRRSPTLREMGEGLGMEPGPVHAMLVKLEVRGAVARVGGARGWVPLRAP